MTISDVKIIEYLWAPLLFQGRPGTNPYYIRIDPYPSAEDIKQASVDVYLDNTLVEPDPKAHPFEIWDYYELLPNEFILGSTLEKVSIGTGVVCRVEGVSTLGRLGLQVHSTAGFVDPGFSGQITLELKNIGPDIIRLEPQMRICQLTFDKLDPPASKPYEGRYQNQKGPQQARPSLFDKDHRDFND